MAWVIAALLVLLGVAVLWGDRFARKATPRRTGRHDRADRRAAHYRASGALPPWD